MNLVKKILIVHGDAKARRRLVLLLADAGFDVRAFATAESAAENARGEWFDLAIVDHDLRSAPGFEFVDTLKRVQPTVRVLLLVSQLELPVVVQGIRVGVADVVASKDDPRALLTRVRSLLDVRSSANQEPVTPEELAEVENVIENLTTGSGNSANPFGVHAQDPDSELLKLSKEKALLEARVERLQHEKTAFEAELKALLTQNADGIRLQTELAELNSERELAAAAQAAIDEKARELREARAAIASERSALEQEKQRLAAASPAVPTDEALARERAELTAWKQRLATEEAKVADDVATLRQETMHLTQERRRLHEDLDLLRAQEENLRAYETRLRQIQAKLEADRVLFFSSGTQQQPAQSPFTSNAALQEAWAKLQRASELLEAERTNFRDDRLAMQEHHAAVKRREEQVRDREIQLSLQEKKLRELPPVKARVTEPDAADKADKALTRGPFGMARAVFGVGKKG
jgi:DNA-binding response OmpR family regulator